MNSTNGGKIYMKNTRRLLSLFLLIIPMFILLFGCNPKNEFGIREKNDKNMVKLDRWGDTSGISLTLVNDITLTGEEGSEFSCSIGSGDTKEAGTFLFGIHHDVTSATVSSGTTIYWFCQYSDGTESHISKAETVWLEFINRKDSQIIGYVVVKVNRIADFHYEPEVVKAVTFPKVNGKYQEVTDEQVNQLIAEIEKSPS